MLNRKERMDLITRIDFGDIDGYGDPNLDRYFLDDGYWNKIVNDSTFYVIGRKGTGKSAIYRMIREQGIKNGDLIENRDFGDFPFEKLLTLSDDNFSMPNQYQSIWKNLILNLFSVMIARIPENNNPYAVQIAQYVEECMGNVVELHRELVNYIKKSTLGLHFSMADVSGGAEKDITIGDGSRNLTKINSALYELIGNYFMTAQSETKFIIQFDRLDDNYNQYQKTENYYHAIISLFKTVYQINQDFRAKKIANAKVVLYLRSDIYRELGKRDAESARWDDFRIDINWAIINKDDWANPKLLQMIDKRIHNSHPELGAQANFRTLFDREDINLLGQGRAPLDVFRYIAERTMHRPRDIIKFCKCIQTEIRESGDLFFRTIKNAEKTYAYWLTNDEIANEINPVLKNTEPVYSMLRLIGAKPFSLADFHARYRSVKGIEMDEEHLANYLYDIGIIENIDLTVTPPRHRSINRNYGMLDRNMQMIIHTGVWRGLMV